MSVAWTGVDWEFVFVYRREREFAGYSDASVKGSNGSDLQCNREVSMLQIEGP